MFYQEYSKESIDSIKYNNLHTLLVYYQRLLITYKYTCNNLWFNRECKKYKICPRYIEDNIKCRRLTKESKKAIHNAKCVWLKEELRKSFRKRDNISVHLKIFYSEISWRLHWCEFNEVQEKYHDKAQELSHLQYTRQKAKLVKLLEEYEFRHRVDTQKWQHNNTAFYPRVISDSSIEFTSEEWRLLSNGLNFAPNLRVRKDDIADLAVHIDAALPEDEWEGRLVCARQIRSQLKQNKNERLDEYENMTLEAIKNKIKTNDLILCKADKGNSISIFKKLDYLEKMKNCLQDMRLEDLKSDPTLKFNQTLIKLVNNSNSIFTPTEKYNLKVSNPAAPILYGLPKHHKTGIPFRPVASSMKAPTQKLCSKLSNILPSTLDFKPKFTVKNSLELIDKIKNLEIPIGSKLISFDVKSLFPSVPTSKLFKLLCDRIKLKLDDKEKASQLIDLTKICFEQNYFMFNGNFFRQVEGLAMGSSLSPFCADFFMNEFECELFDSGNTFLKNIVCWHRYVDDILCIWKGSERQLKLFLNNVLNKIDNNIQFTVEMGGNTINFLDITITIDNLYKKLNFNIFRKDTYTDSIIPMNSVHPLSTKKAALHSMLNRLLKIPLSKIDYSIELKSIVQIAKNNGYKKDLIYKMLWEKKRKLWLNLFFPGQRDIIQENWKKIPYVKNLSGSLTKKLMYYNVKPAFSNRHTLKNLLTNNKLKPEFDKLKSSGIYKIKCNDCDAWYIGKTKRNLKIRFSEHKNGGKMTTPTSGLSQHLKLSKHSINVDNLELVRKADGGRVMDKYEILEIKRAKKANICLLNNQLDFLNNSPLLNF